MNMKVNQKDILAFIRDYRKTHPYGPTIREMCKGVGLKSTSSMASRICTLETRGLVSMVPKIPRTIVLTEKGVAALEKAEPLQ